MSLERARTALRSEEQSIVVVAAAGCGKTYEAASLALDLVPTLPVDGNVLLLAHTNGAVQEFARRTDGQKARIRVSTIDAFCLELIAHYTSALDLPTPLIRNLGIGAGRVAFETLAPKAAGLLTRCPTICRIIGMKYPVIILDEHQDARTDQHGVVRLLATTGRSRIRAFGDPMQAIFEEPGGRSLDWTELERDANARFELLTPQRWTESRALGEWIMQARTALLAGRPLPLRDRPACVRVTLVRDMPDMNFGLGLPRYLANPLHQFLNRCGEASGAVLAYRKRATLGFFTASRGRAVLNEGAEFDAAYSTLETAAAAVGQPARLCAVLLDHLEDVATGLDSRRRCVLNGAFANTAIHAGMNQSLRTFMEVFRPIYERPDLASFCEVAQAVGRRPPEWLMLRMPQSLRLLGRIRPSALEDGFVALDAAVSLRKLLPNRAAHSISTVHKAKGQEFDHVLIANFSRTHFPDTVFGRRFAYVAISRARRTLEFMVPALAPSPLLA